MIFLQCIIYHLDILLERFNYIGGLNDISYSPFQIAFKSLLSSDR